VDGDQEKPGIKVDRLLIAQLFEKWRKPLRSWLRNHSSVPPLWIDDLAQEVFLRMMRYSEDTELENPQGYIFRVAANVANEWREKAAVRYNHGPEGLEDLLTEPEQEPGFELEQLDRTALIHDAISRLPVRQQEVLRRHVAEGQTYNRIAKDLGLTYRIVLRDLTRSYMGLRIMLRNTDLTDVVLLSPGDLSKIVGRHYSEIQYKRSTDKC
jgi:RNA polymerase sigma-70 factor (ECF subfamily)